MSNRIMMVDDHPVVRAGLRALLEADEGIEVIAEVGTGDEALRVLDELAASSPGLPDLVLMDLNLGDGIGGIETWRDAVEFLLLGSSSVQVCTAVMHYGYRIVEDLIDGNGDEATPGAVEAAAAPVEFNAGRRTTTLEVVHRGDRPIQVGSHYHFAETNAAQVRRVRAILEGLGLAVATPDEARAMLSLKGGHDVAF